MQLHSECIAGPCGSGASPDRVPWLHSWSSLARRRLMDLPSHGRAVHLRVQVRRFRCGNAACPRTIFGEPADAHSRLRGAANPWLRGWLRRHPTLCSQLAACSRVDIGRSVRASQLRAGRSLSVRLEPRGCIDSRHDGDREGLLTCAFVIAGCSSCEHIRARRRRWYSTRMIARSLFSKAPARAGFTIT